MECLRMVLEQSDEPVLLQRVAGSVGDACAGSGKSWRPPSKQLEGRQSGLPTSNLPAICRKSSSGLDRSPLAPQPSAPSPDAPQIQVSTSPPLRTSRPGFFPQSLWACGGHRWLAAPSPWKGLQSGPSMVKSKQDGGRSQHKHQSSYAKKRKVQVSQASLSCLSCLWPLSLPLSCERLYVRVGWVGPKSSWSI